jgi:thioredoxin-like negative regulator of GroEL
VAYAVSEGVAAAQDEIAAARRSLLALSPDDPGVVRIYGLAGLASLEGQSDEAFELLTEAVRREPGVVTDWATKDAAWRTLRADLRFAAALDSPDK